MRFLKRLLKGRPAELAPTDCQMRRKIISRGFGFLIILPLISLLKACSKIPTSPESGDQENLAAAGKSGLPKNTDDLIVPRNCTLSQLLDRLYPYWVRWQNAPNINGDGIWSIPGRITSGMCNVLVNGTIVWGGNINVDTIQLSRGDSLAVRPV